MCCGGKCLFFISYRTGSLIFGYMSAVISGAGTIACTIAAMIFLVQLMFPYDYHETYQSNGTYDYRTRNLTTMTSAVLIITAFLIEFLSGFICSVLLLVGITQNKSPLVKTYIIYGILQGVFILIFFIIMHIATSFFAAGYLILVAAILGLYTMCLYMVFLVYQPMIRENMFLNPRAMDQERAVLE